MSEHDHQAALIRVCELHVWKYPELGLLFAIPNGSFRQIQTARRLKAEGVKAGVPDLCLPVARGPYFSLWLEMKVEGGRVSPAQHEWHEALRAEGCRVEVCRGWETAWLALKGYLDLAPSNINIAE